MDSAHGWAWQARGWSVNATLDECWPPIPAITPRWHHDGAVLYVSALPGAVSTGVITRDGQDIKLVEQLSFSPPRAATCA